MQRPARAVVEAGHDERHDPGRGPPMWLLPQRQEVEALIGGRDRLALQRAPDRLGRGEIAERLQLRHGLRAGGALGQRPARRVGIGQAQEVKLRPSAAGATVTVVLSGGATPLPSLPTFWLGRKVAGIGQGNVGAARRTRRSGPIRG